MHLARSPQLDKTTNKFCDSLKETILNYSHLSEQPDTTAVVSGRLLTVTGLEPALKVLKECESGLISGDYLYA